MASNLAESFYVKRVASNATLFRSTKGKREYSRLVEANRKRYDVSNEEISRGGVGGVYDSRLGDVRLSSYSWRTL